MLGAQAICLVHLAKSVIFRLLTPRSKLIGQLCYKIINVVKFFNVYLMHM